MTVNLLQVGQKTERVERHWIGGSKRDLEVYRIPLEHLYFNIENGRYADRMIRLRHEHPGVSIDPREDKWKEKIEEMLAGEHKDTARDSAAFKKLIEDIEARDHCAPVSPFATVASSMETAVSPRCVVFGRNPRMRRSFASSRLSFSPMRRRTRIAGSLRPVCSSA